MTPSVTLSYYPVYSTSEIIFSSVSSDNDAYSVRLFSVKILSDNEDKGKEDCPPEIQSTLVNSTSIISNNRLSRRENLVLVLTQKFKIRLQNIVEKKRNSS